MKKYLFIFLLFPCIKADCQNAFYDAQFIKRCVNNTGNTISADNFKSENQVAIQNQITALDKYATDLQTTNPVLLSSQSDSIGKVREKLKNLDKSISVARYDSLIIILGRYFNTINAAISGNSDSLTKIIQANPFLQQITINGTQRGKTPFSLSSLASTVQSVGGLDVTKYANAIADIMIERAKLELTVAFFDRFKKFAKDNPEFGILFPATTDNLDHLVSFTYPQMLPALRDGFFKDLKEITYRLDDVFDLPRYRSLLQNFPEIKIAIRSIRIVHELETGASNAADVIQEFASFDEWKTSSSPAIKSAGSCLTIASLFSESIRNDSTQSHTDDVWVPAKDLKQLFYDTTLFKIYLGLVYQQSVNKSIAFVDSSGTSKPFAGMLAAQKDHLFLFQNKLKEFADLAGTVNTSFQNLQNKIKDKSSPSNDDIYNYISTSISIVEYGFSIVKVFHETPVADDFVDVIKKSNSLYKDIYTKAYTQAFSDAFDVFAGLKNLIKPQQPAFDVLKNNAAIKSYSGTAKADVESLAESDQKFTKVNDQLDKVAEANITVPAIEQLVEHYSLDGLFRFIEKVKPYALFMANMVEAKSDAEVKAALENVILPVGSSSVKKFTLCNVSVQSYLGAYLSYAGRNTASGSWSDHFGVIAPIGISLTPGFLSFGSGGSLSPFISLIDLGAIVDYKLKREPDAGSTDPNATVLKKDYTVKLGQIFSPGAYLVYGFPFKLPLSLGVGAQYGPGLSKINTDNTTITGNPTWRGNVFFAVDIPFFNLKNKIRHP